MTSPKAKDLAKFRNLSPRVKLVDFDEPHIKKILEYWFRSPSGFVESLGTDLQRLGSEKEMRSNLEKRVQQSKIDSNFKMPTLVIEFDKEPIGFHALSHINEPVGKQAIFHSHIWNTEFRGMGIGLVTYILGADIFMKRFNLDTILYETPKMNASPNRVKEKLGIRKIGEGLISHPMCRPDLEVWKYELTRTELRKLKQVWIDENGSKIV